MVNKITFDIESSGLDYTVPDFKIHCISVYNHSDGYKHTFANEGEDNFLSHGVEYLLKADVLIGHNIIGYDLPALRRVFKVDFTAQILDDYIRWQLLEPERRGVGAKQLAVFNLGKAGDMLGYSKKTAFNYSGDLSICSQETIEQCERDVEISVALHNYLNHKTKETDHDALNLEMRVAEIIQRQTAHGVYFDRLKAYDLKNELGVDKDRVTTELQYSFPAILNKTKLIDFNPGSTKQVAHRLIQKYNWKPIQFTPTGLPQVNEQVLKSLEYPEAKQILEYNDLEKTISFIESWLAVVKEDGRIHASLNPVGTITRRMTHYKPNLSQVPSARKTNGKGCRSLFCAPPGRVLVGMDVKGLEARILAHYAAPYDNGYLIKLVESGDIHNITATGLYGKEFTSEQRNIAKTVFFAKVFGAFPKRLAKIMGTDVREGTRIFEALNRTYPHLLELEKACKEVAIEYRKIKVIDGFWVPVDFKKLPKTDEEYPDSPVNRLVQTTGAVICKRTLILAEQTMRNFRIEPEFVLNNHDEIEVECDIKDSQKIAIILRGAITRAGQFYELRCKLEGETKIGQSWADVH
jgi:DNA polymerase-1